MEDYGVQLFRYGVVVHVDRRNRCTGLDGEPGVLPSRLERRTVAGLAVGDRYVEFHEVAPRRKGHRGQIQAFTPASMKQLAFVAANALGEFRTLMTLTYRAQAQEWESDGQRNLRVVERSKEDLHRFLCALRPEMGAYLWVQEFQQRGVIHYHAICEREVADERVRFVWVQAIGALEDPAALQHGAKATLIREQARVRGYLAKYFGKTRQKELPPGVGRAGRWWGRSRSLKLDLVTEVVSCEKGLPMGKRAEVRIVRCVRKYLERFFRAVTLARLARTTDPEECRRIRQRLRRRFRGGWFVSWGGELPAALVGMIERLRSFYGVTQEVPASIAEFQWAVDEYTDERGEVHEIRPEL